jgi:hypothetical protein
MPLVERFASVTFVCLALSAISTLARAQGESDVERERLRLHVHYDYMGYSSGQDACSTDNQCTALGAGHAGERCIGPAVVPSAPHSCIFACTTDTECTARGGGHVGDRCVAERCQHTHNPAVIAPGAIEEVVDSFARQGIDLIIDPVHHNLPHSQVLAEFGRPLSAMTDSCEGGSVASGTAGIGKYAETFEDLKASFFHSKDPDKPVHYAVFGHYTTCDIPGHCNPPGGLGPCQATRLTDVPPSFGASGLAIIDGGFPLIPLARLPPNFMVTLGNIMQDRNVRPTIFNVGGTFMHELGHNLGLRHGGGSDIDQSAEDVPTFKPNFLSVMNYKFQLVGINVADAIGSYMPKTSRLDYSSQVLPTGGNTPGALTEGGPGLNEVAGLGSGTADLTSFDDGACGFGFQPTNGPLDFDGDGNKTGLHVSVDLNRQDHQAVLGCPSGVTETLVGHNDWVLVRRMLASSSTPGAKQSAPVLGNAISSPELTADMAEAHHALHPPRTVAIQIRPGCAAERARIAPGKSGPVTVVVLGEPGLEVNEIEPSSLTFAGARQLSYYIADVNKDGQPDLIAVFDMEHMRLHPTAGSARVSGWFKNSQMFVGSGQVTVVSTLEAEVANCRQ